MFLSLLLTVNKHFFAVCGIHLFINSIKHLRKSTWNYCTKFKKENEEPIEVQYAIRFFWKERPFVTEEQIRKLSRPRLIRGEARKLGHFLNFYNTLVCTLEQDGRREYADEWKYTKGFIFR